MAIAYQATALLAVSILGAALAIFWNANGGGFVAGLLSHGLLAASIGGLADWFAVTAIFRRPLGIGWRTDILRRHRARMTKELVAFASVDLLSRENIMSILAKEDFAKMLLSYLTERGGTKRLTTLADTIVCDTIDHMDVSGLCAALTLPIREGLASIDLAPLLGEGRKALRERGEPEKLIQAFLPILRQGMAEPAVQELLLTHIVAVREAYEGQSLGRSALFSLMGLSDEKLLSLCNEKIAEGFSQLESGEGSLWDEAQGWVHRQLAGSCENQDWQRWLEEWKAKAFSRMDLTGAAQRYWEAYREENRDEWRTKTRTLIEGYVRRFAHEEAWQRRVNQSLLHFFSALLERHHAEIPRLIEAYMGRLSDDALVALAESKVADDLQMIRVNGSVVGAVIGMILYLLTCLVGRLGG
ncbi:MAG: DUF445 family protein [Schwartzia sp. (in: firmicutes)]